MINLIILEERTTKREKWYNLMNQQQNIKCVAIFDNYEEAIKKISTIPCDIVLMDFNQKSDKIGLETIQKLSKCRGVQVLIYSSLDDDEHIFDALKAGAGGYILKNSPHSKVVQAIQELHDGGVPMSAFVAKRVLYSFQKQRKTENHYQLSPREHEILNLLQEGYLYKEIANQLELTIGTIKQYTHTVYRKLKVENRTEALNKYFSNQNQQLQY